MELFPKKFSAIEKPEQQQQPSRTKMQKMFSFRHDRFTDTENPVSDVGVSEKDDAESGNRLYETLCEFIAEPKDVSTDIVSTTSDSTNFSTDISELSMYSNDGIARDGESLSTVSFKPTLESFLHRLDQATNTMTPPDEALDLFNHLHISAIDAVNEERDRNGSSFEIRDELLRKLLRYIRANLDKKECVFKAVTLIDCLSCHKDHEPLALVEADAINVLVLVLISNNSYSFYNHDSSTHKNGYAGFVWRPWDILLDIVLAPSFVEYFQRSDEDHPDEKQESQRKRLLILVQFLLDVCGHSMSELRMGQLFEILSLLLQVDYGTGSLEPNDRIRDFVWEARIASKCQRIVSTMDSRDAENHDEASIDLYRHSSGDETAPVMRALTFFRMCLCDCDDYLSQSLDTWTLSRWVRKTLGRFPGSPTIQGLGCQILNEITARRNIPENCAASVATTVIEPLAANCGNHCGGGRNLLDGCL